MSKQVETINLSGGWYIQYTIHTNQYTSSIIYDEDAEEMYSDGRRILKREAEMFKQGYLKALAIGKSIGESTIQHKLIQILGVENIRQVVKE